MGSCAALASSFVLLLAPLATPSSSDIAFAAKPLAAGAKFAVTAKSSVKLAMTVKMGGNVMQQMDLPSRLDLDCTASVGEVDGVGTKSGKLVFGKCEELKPSAFGAPVAKACDVSDQSYDVVRGDAGYTAKRDKAELSDDEVEQTTRVTDIALAPSPLAPLLEGKTMKKGEVIDVPSDVAQKLLSLFATDATVNSLQLTFDGERTDGATPVAIFKAVAKAAVAKTDATPAEMTMELSGEIAVAASGRVVSIDMKGPVKMAGGLDQGGMKIEFEGKGECTFAYSTKDN